MKSISYEIKNLLNKRWVKFSLVAALLVTPAVILSGCGNSAAQKNTVKVGVVGSDDDRIWKPIEHHLKKEGVHVKLTHFSDYNQPNEAVQAKEDNVNSFQTIQFLNTWDKAHHAHLVSAGKTVIAPLAIYSKKISSLHQLKKGSKVALPNDASNEARSLNLLQSAGLIKIKKGVSLPTTKDVVSNKKDLKLSPIDAAQTPRALKDDSVAVINSGIALDAGLNPKKALFIEKVNKKILPYVNVIATTKSEKKNKAVKKVVKAYQSKENAKRIKKIFKGANIPAWNVKF